MLTAALSIYIAGFIVTLLVLHKYKKQLDIDSYDPPHPDYYDDYRSNSEAYAWFSAIWPLWWFFQIIIWLCTGLYRLSMFVEKLVK